MHLDACNRTGHKLFNFAQEPFFDQQSSEVRSPVHLLSGRPTQVIAGKFLVQDRRLLLVWDHQQLIVFLDHCFVGVLCHAASDLAQDESEKAAGRHLKKFEMIVFREHLNQFSGERFVIQNWL